MYLTVKIIFLGVLKIARKERIFCSIEISRRNLYSPNMGVLRYEGKETHLTTRIDEGGSIGHLFTHYFINRVRLVYVDSLLTVL